MKNNFVKILIVFSLIFTANFSFAQVSDYVRTPSDLEILEGTSINFSGLATFSNNVESISVRVNSLSGSEYSSCIGELPSSDEQEFDINMVLPVGDYYSVEFLGDVQDDCSSDPYVIEVESGSPAFSIVSIPVGNCDPFDKVCYYDWLIMNLVFLFLISTFIFTGFVSVLFPKKEKQEL